MAKQRFLNNFTSTFIAAVKDAPSSGTPETELDYGVLRISDGAAGSLINPTDGDYYLLTAFKRSGSVESNIEVMRVTSVNNATPGECRITVQRAQEGTSAKAFVAGDYLSLRITKGTAENFAQPADLSTKEQVIAAPGSAPTEKYWRGDKTWRDFFTDVRAATLTGLSTATNAVVAATDTVIAAIGKLQAQVSAKFDKTGGDVDGNLNFTGAARRITGDFSIQTANAIDPNGYDAGKIRFYESGSSIYGIGVSSQQLNFRSADAHVLYSGTNEVARVSSGAALTLGDRLRVGQSTTFNSLPNATDWLRLCSFNGDNQPKYVRFTLSSTGHDHWLVEFSPGAGGDAVRAKVTLLGVYTYYSQYPLQWRICKEGVNAPCHIDIKFGGAGGFPYKITVLESYATAGSSTMASFPCINVGTSANGGGESYGIQFGTTSGITYREFELIPGYYARLSSTLARTNGTIAANTVVV